MTKLKNLEKFLEKDSQEILSSENKYSLIAIYLDGYGEEYIAAFENLTESQLKSIVAKDISLFLSGFEHQNRRIVFLLTQNNVVRETIKIKNNRSLDALFLNQLNILFNTIRKIIGEEDV